MNLYCNSTTISPAISNSSSNRLFACHSRNFLPRFPDGEDDKVARILRSRQHLWPLAANYMLLDIMGGIYDLLRLSNDNTFKNFLWTCGFDLLVEQCRIVSVDENFLSVLTLRKMEQKWKKMKREYARLKSLNNLTGIGGVHPNITWPFYDDVGQVLKNDKDIHWDVNIESTSLDADNTGTIRTRGQEEGDTAQRRHPTDP